MRVHARSFQPQKPRIRPQPETRRQGSDVSVLSRVFPCCPYVGEDTLYPPVDIVVCHKLIEPLEAMHPLRAAKLQRLLHRIHDAVNVPRVDREGPRQHPRAPKELRDAQRIHLRLPTHDILERAPVQPRPHACVEVQVADGEVRGTYLGRLLVRIDDLDGAWVRRVDAIRKLMNQIKLPLLTLQQRLSRVCRVRLPHQLHKHKLAVPDVRGRPHQRLERSKLERDATQPVTLVARHNDCLALVLFGILRLEHPHVTRIPQLPGPSDIKADQAAPYVHPTSVEVHSDEASPRSVLQAKKPRAAVEEVASILEEIEGDKIRAQQSAKQLNPHGKHPEHLRGGEDGEKGETNRGSGHLADRVVRHQHHLIVQYPYPIPWNVRPPLGHGGEGRVGKYLVDLLILVPPVPLPAAFAPLLSKLNDVMEDRAEDALAEDIKDAIRKLLIEEHGIAPKLCNQLQPHSLLLLRRHLHPNPPDVLEVTLGVAQLGSCTAVVPLEGPSVILAPRPQGQQRRHNHNPKVGHLAPLAAHSLHVIC
mmetsp:Transcript_42261/g.82675  ORF Transcript_42261/g.82675 Transcript_42261/m.82675 type:complete len:532 (-) Transcript_42261:422-2017(-)